MTAKIIPWLLGLNLSLSSFLSAAQTSEPVPVDLQPIFDQAALRQSYHLEYSLTGALGEDWKDWRAVRRAYALAVAPDGANSPEPLEPVFDEVRVVIDLSSKMSRYLSEFTSEAESTRTIQYQLGSSYLQYIPAHRQAHLGKSGLVRVYLNPVKLLDFLPSKPKVSILAYSWDVEKMVPLNHLSTHPSIEIISWEQGPEGFVTLTYQYQGGIPIKCSFTYKHQQIREITYQSLSATSHVPPDWDQSLCTRIKFSPLRPGELFPRRIEVDHYQSVSLSRDQWQHLKDRYSITPKREYCTEKRYFQIKDFRSLPLDTTLTWDPLPRGTVLDNSLTNTRRRLDSDTEVMAIMP